MHVRSDIDEPPAKRCKFCDEPARDAEQHTLWFLTLDLDLINWIKERYPNWFNHKNTIQQPVTVSTTTAAAAAVAVPLIGRSTVAPILSIPSRRGHRTPPLLASIPSLLTIPAKLSPIKAEINTSYTNSICSSIVTDKMAEGEQPAAPSNITDSPLMGSVDEFTIRRSPPKVVVDTTPLQPQMDKNKESLKVKLMLRRTADQLADIGIYPTLTTSPALHEQRKQLERAKTGDLLKAKIQQRPDRRELERRHILEHEESFVDPSLAEKQRMLKKARLADQLSSQITHRPGPLELIKKNILHTEEPIERIVKQGLVPFKSTSEGLLSRPQHPNSYTVCEDDSQSSEGDLSCSPLRQDVLEAAAASAGIVTVTIPTSGGPVFVTTAPVSLTTTKFNSTLLSTTHVPPPPPPPPPLITNIKTETFSLKNNEATSTPTLFAELCQSVAGTITGNTSSLLNLASSPSSLGSTLSPLSSECSPPGPFTPRPIPSPLQQHNQKSEAPGKDKNRKKSKTKPITKERTIKFHEYKGPPNSQKNSNNVSNSKKVEEWYQICLNQQNCLVDLEGGISTKQKAILPAPMKLTAIVSNQNDVIMSQPSPAPSNTSSIPPSPAPSFTQENNNININNNNSSNNINNNNSNNGNISNNNNSLLMIEFNKLEKMKVSDLKLQLKKRNLPVSGPKPQLIERLKPFLPLDSNNNNNNINSNNNNNGDTCDIDLNYNSPKNSQSPESEHENNNNGVGSIGNMLNGSCNTSTMMDIQQDSPMSFSLIGGGRQTPLITNDDIVREQQRQIDELQRQLKEKQEELQQMKTQQNNITILDKQQQDSIKQKLKVKKCLEAKIFKEKLQQIENLNRKNLLLNGVINSNSTSNINSNNNNINNNNNNSNNITSNNNINSNNNTIVNSNPIFITSIKEEPITIKTENTGSTGNLELLWHETTPTTLVLVDLNNENKKLINGHHRTSSMPSILVPITADLDLKPPPPQYEEATKLKIEHNTNSNSSTASSNNNGGNPVLKSQELSDVLDILITNGELPESVLSSTPNTPSIQHHPNHMDETNMNLNLFDTSSLHDHHHHQHHNLHQHHHHHHPDDEHTFTSLILDTHSDVLNDLDCMSPMQSDHHNDIDETAKTLDMLLGQTTTSNHHSNNVLNNNHNSNSNHSNSSNNSNDNNSDKLIKFSELDFNNWPAYELMKLEMDMGDDCNNQFNGNNSNNSNSINNNNNNNNSSSNNNNKKRDMNPSLQPSLNELISSSSNSNHDYIIFNGGSNMANNNNNCDAMDVDFVNSLSSFDFRTIISPTRSNSGINGNLNSNSSNHHHHHNHHDTIDTPPHPFQSLHNMNHHHNSGANNLHMQHNGLLDNSVLANTHHSQLQHLHQNGGNNIVTGHESIFDLNLDELNVGAGDQMSWEVDFTLMNCH